MIARILETITAFLQDTIDTCGRNYLLCRVAVGDIIGDEASCSLDLFTRRVMPDLAVHQETV